MRPFPILACVGGCLLLTAPHSLGETSDSQIRASIRKSLPLLGRTGPVFFEKTGCVSCHNISLPSMAMVLASERGFEVDEGARKQNIRSAVASKVFFEPRDMMKLDQIPGQTMTVGYTLMALEAEGYPSDALTDAMAIWAAETQSADGSWRLTAHRTPIEYSSFTGTALGLRSMQLYGPPGKRERFARSIAKALEWLERNAARDSEDRNFRLLGLGWGGAGEKVIREAVDDVVRQQRPDGGWAQLAGLGSDAYATGQALYALHVGGEIPANHDAYRKGVAYLLETQLEDGTWLVPTRSRPVQPYFESGFPHGPDQWISCAATSWATMVLTYALDAGE